MALIDWRKKLIAFCLHFLATAVLAAIAAALIFLVWFPHPFATMVGGTELFGLVVGCDLILGPLITLVIYNPRKTRRQLISDYSVVGAVQIAALVYGVYVVAGTRPVEVAFNRDRLEVVTARDIDAAELAAARAPEYHQLSLTGPRYVSIQVPPADAQDALLQSVAGNEEHQRPKFYAPYEAALEQIRKRARRMRRHSTRRCARRASLHSRRAGCRCTIARDSGPRSSIRRTAGRWRTPRSTRTAIVSRWRRRAGGRRGWTPAR